METKLSKLHLENSPTCFITQLKLLLRLTLNYLTVTLILCIASYFVSLFYKVIFFQIIKYLCLCYLVFILNELRITKLSPYGIYFVGTLCMAMAIRDGISWRHYSKPQLFSTERPHFFIAGNLYNNENIFYDYTRALEEFIQVAGRKNVFISIIEDHSTDRTPILLRNWSQKLHRLGVPHKIITGFKMPDPKKVDNIEKLAYLRNAALQPFFDSETGFVDPTTMVRNSTNTTSYYRSPKLNPGISKDSRVIFLNDIYFFKEDLISLINTKGGDYDAACATDYGAFMLFDTWVIRDRNGRVVNTYYPFFHDQVDQLTWSMNQPVKVYSCWNGLVVFNPQLILDHFSPQLIPHLIFPHSLPDFFRPESSLPAPADVPGVRFRAQTSPDECYASECLLIWHDIQTSHPTPPLTIYMNPTVKVAYSLLHYLKYKELLSWSLVRWYYKSQFDPVHFHPTVTHRDESHYDCWDWDKPTLYPRLASPPN